MRSKKQVRIFGASGAGNVGDDLIAAILLKALRKSLPNANVEILPQQHEPEVRDADALIIGGGGLIYDYDYENVRIYTELIHLANSYRIPIYMSGMGVQHVFSQKAVEAYRNSIRLVKKIATRGIRDGKYIINDLNYPPQRVIESRDLVFLYEDMFGKITKQNKNEKPVLILSLADWQLGGNYKKIDPALANDYKNYRKYINENLPKLKDIFEIKIINQARQDLELSQELSQLLNAEMIDFPTIESSEKFIDEYLKADFVITSRYHGLIAALIADVPVLGVAFNSHKQENLIKDSFPTLKKQFYSVGQFTKDDVIEKMSSQEFRDSLKTRTKEEYEECVSLARRNFDIFKYVAGDLDKLLI